MCSWDFMLEKMAASQVECTIERAKLAEQCERYEDMVCFVKKSLESMEEGKDLSTERRNLFSVAYKNAVGSRRAAWRILSRATESKDERMAAIAIEYRGVVEKELMGICNDALALLDKRLIPAAESSGSVESEMFYHKMRGDYYRYLAEVTTEQQLEEYKKASRESYDKATEAAFNGMPATHPVRLGLSLSYSVFYYEILNEPEKAVDIAKKAFDAAVPELDTLEEDSYKDSILIMRLLRDNLMLWTSEDTAEGDVD